ncbi:MAG TPA: T9SS type A sorting domain-containing protein, partial [Chitinophagales bacterium]|nr:T9SS type A sorting domain-containing protein [Chitinophagales bacterium]
MTVLDKTLNAGNGGIVSINQVILSDTLSNWGGGLAVTKHANGRDWWILVKKHYRNKFYKFLLTPWGVQSMGFQQIGLDYLARLLDAYSFSPNGEILGGNVGDHDIALFKFDRCSGVLSNHQILTNPGSNQHYCEDIDFSPNSEVLYTNEMVKIYQFNLLGINTPGVVQQTRTLIADTAWTTEMCDPPGSYKKNYFSFGALAGNSKIYYPSNFYCPELTYIEYPDSAGLACSFNYAGINIINVHSAAIPYFPNYRLGPVTGSVCDSLTAVHELKSDEVSLYPNPAKDHITLQSKRSLSKAVITLMNVQGQVLFSRQTGTGTGFEVELPRDMGNGIYFLRIHSTEGAVSKKVVVQR